MPFFVIPREGDAAEFGGLEVSRYGVVLLHGVGQVGEIFDVAILDQEVIYDQCEVYSTGLVLEQAWDPSSLDITCCEESGEECVVGYLACLG